MKLSIYLLLTISLATLSSLAETTRDNEVFIRKCYAQLTSQRIAKNSDYLNRVKAGENPVSLCMEILDRAKLDSSGKIDDDEIDGIGVEVLNNMHQLHSNFFSMRDYDLQNTQITRSTLNYMDPSQPAYYITKSLFSDWTYDNAITSQTTLQAIRTEMNPTKHVWRNESRASCTEADHTIGCARYVPKFYSPSAPVSKVAASGLSCLTDPSPATCDQYKSYIDLSNSFAPRGKMIGVQNHPGVKNPHGFLQYQDSTRVVSDFKDGAKNLGAGIIGDPVFMLSNESHSAGYKADGADLVHRSWAKAVYEDILCRQLPALRPSDVGFLKSENPATPSFRTGTSCLRCHSSMDQTAGVVRNVQYIYSASNRNGNYVFSSVRIKPWSISSNESWRETRDSNWHNSTPFGRLLYRDYEGNLIHHSANNLQQMGKLISETDDYYLCAAKNYYKHFVNVELHLSDPKSPNYIEDAKDHKEELIRIGLKFKEHKSLRLLVQDIFESKYYFSREGNE